MGKIYFASDFHLGAPTPEASRARELRIVRWLDMIKSDAEALYLMGDIFDFWFEYKHVIPKGYVRFLGKLAELRDAGIPIYFYTGNHDMWVFSYLKEELDIPVFYHPQSLIIKGKRFYIGHGDGLGPDDKGMKRLKKVFNHKAFHWFFNRFHPNFSFMIANYWSGTSRKKNLGKTEYYGPTKEWLILYTEEKVKRDYHDFFVFGHRHLAIDYTLHNHKSRYINLGEWFSNNSYAVFDGKNMEVRFFENSDGQLANR